MRVRLLRVAAVAIPVVALLVLFHYLAPGLRRARLTAELPAGYGVIREQPEYVVYGDRSSETARHAAEVLGRFTEAVRGQFGELLKLAPPRIRCDVIVFRSHDDLSDYGRERFDTDFDRNGGFYLPADRILAVIGRRDFTGMMRALFHEGTHLMMDTWVKGTDHDWSLWLNEGLATWFEDSRFTARGVRLGGVQPESVEMMRRAIEAGKWVPVPRLLAATAGDFRGTENGLYYAQSGLLVDFLMQAEWRERLAAYLDAERRPGPVRPGTFERRVEDPHTMDDRLRRYLARFP